MNREIFRASALARMASPDQLDQLMRVTSARGWVALFAVGIVLATAVVWGFEGTLATKAAGTGVVTRTGNMRTIGTLGGGRVIAVDVKVGDEIKEGQLVASVAQPSQLEKIRSAEAELTDARKEKDRRASVRSESARLETDSYEKRRASLEQQIRSQQNEAKTVAEEIPVQEELLAKGLVTRRQVLTLRERLAGIENNIAGLQTQIVELDANQNRDQNVKEQSTVDFDSRITDLQRNLVLLKQELELTSKVTSPYAGQVIEVSALPGSLVAVGANILTVQPDVEQLELVGFVSAAHAKEVKRDMDVEVVPSSVKVEEYGFIRGKVESIAEFPSTESALMLLFQNSALVQTVAKSGSVHEVHVRLLPRDTTPSGFEWSSKDGAPIKLTPGTTCEISIVTREQAPVTMVFPYIKKTLGIY
jgi:HlyD family secretion protein